MSVSVFLLQSTEDGDGSGPWSNLTSYLTAVKGTKHIGLLLELDPMALLQRKYHYYIQKSKAEAPVWLLHTLQVTGLQLGVTLRHRLSSMREIFCPGVAAVKCSNGTPVSVPTHNM